jgi:hypothetical protein
MQQDCLKRLCTAARLHGVTYFRRQQFVDAPQSQPWPSLAIEMAHVWCPAAIHSDLLNTWIMFGVQLLYTLIYRTLMVHVWCPATINSDVPNTYGSCLVSSSYTQWCTEHLGIMFGVQLLYTVMYQSLMADVWCPGTIHSDLPNTQWPTLKDLRLRTWLRDYHIIKPHYHL